MTRYILDTNVVSELARPVPSPQVVAFLEREADLWMSTILFHELAYGLERVSDAPRKSKLLAFIDATKKRFEDRILVVDMTVAEEAGRLRAFAAAGGRTLAPLDSLMAATAMVHGATLATRNTKDFRDLGVDIVDPWLGPANTNAPGN
ncbi:type II toxin-antitoxin system VapC family toxin [Inquilinus sp.]|uniref:type II toxin-antitoxin system VapC family toxin n=1 Tax=Inquilinus sp. TaxID=1932117 RepID=UPI00378447AD